MRVLMIEDEPEMARVIAAKLGRSGFIADHMRTLGEARAALAAHRYSFALLDRRLPDGDGISLLAELRKSQPGVRVLVLTACDAVTDKIAALDSGADDYLTKPFGVDELLARLRVALRHAAAAGAGGAPPVYVNGELEVDLAARRVTVAGREVHLTPHEFKLLAFLVKHAGKVVTHRQLLREVWGPEYGDENHYVRVYMAQLRHKLERDPARPRHLLTEPGVGYRLLES
ncbi:MAG: hypothetical protein C3F11_09875 [Methylocystaceae bacterium]|nr:MAG: hypothetical protein C3F11_09875 [Methylocystaceae bacterium]